MTSPTFPTRRAGSSGFGPPAPEPDGYSAARAIEANPGPALHHGAADALADPGPTRRLTSAWLTYPVGYGLLGAVLGMLVMLTTDSASPVVTMFAGTGFAVLALGVYGAILAGLQRLLRRAGRVAPEGIGKLITFLGTIVFAGLAFVTCLLLRIDPWLLTVAAVFAGVLAVRFGQWLVGLLTARHALTVGSLTVCAVLVVVSFAMLPATVAAA
ncbi:hypothetical protein [Ruania albidiflava]|uniref:hypothetical protein n=1 Tax=Ruania albidiflava TaxID=366586 RepID=UPI0003B36FF6|nr:hypothetical protein [Ruania albidiflava]